MPFFLKKKKLVLLLIALLSSLITVTESVALTPQIDLLNRNSFPTGFIFGTASSAYQVQPMRVIEDQAFGIPSLTNILMVSVEGDDLAGLEDVSSDDNYEAELTDGDSNSI
ncbi:hypothetical protein V8G54_004529, partial [Vigna mungo]